MHEDAKRKRSYKSVISGENDAGGGAAEGEGEDRRGGGGLSRGVEAPEGQGARVATQDEDALCIQVREALAAVRRRELSAFYSTIVGTISELAVNMNGGGLIGGDTRLGMGMRAMPSLLRALTASASSIDASAHVGLLGSLFQLNLWMCNDCSGSAEISDGMLRLVVNLVSINGEGIVQLVVQFLAKNIVPPSDAYLEKSKEIQRAVGALTEQQAIASEAKGAAGGATSAEHAADVVVMNHLQSTMTRVRSALEQILSLVPTSSTLALPILVRAMPHCVRRKEVQCSYLYCIFGIAESSAAGASIWDGLFGSVVEKLLEVDVEVRWDDIEDALKLDMDAETRDAEAIETQRELGGDDDHQGVFDLEEFLQDSGDSSSGGVKALDINGERSDIGSKKAPKAAIGEGAVPNRKACSASMVSAEKLDAMMDVTFSHIKRQCAKVGQQEVLRTVMNVFERVLLLAHRSKFTQYVVFHTVCLDSQPQRSSQIFCKMLIEKYAGDEARPTIVRLAALAFASSFVVRFAKIPSAVVVDMLMWLSSSCVREGLRASLGAPGNGSQSLQPSNSNQLSLLHGSCQALLYILCFRLRHLAAGNKEALALKQQLHLDDILLSPLQPLRYCIQDISQEFLLQASHYALFSSEQLRELQGQTHGNASGANVGANGNHGMGRPLELFFPFDPYLLRLSSRRLALGRNYVTSDGAGITPKTQEMELSDVLSDGSAHVDDDDDDDDEDDDVDDDDDDDASSSDSEDDEMARSIRSSEGFARMPGSLDEASPASGSGSLPKVGPYAFTRPTPIAAIAEKYRQRGWSDTSSASEQEWQGATPMSVGGFGASPMAMTPENLKFMMREKKAQA